MAKNTYIDGNNIEFEFKKDDFELCQVDKKIHDVKFESKPTTFFKDALKRFRKNKSSVVGAIIIGILALGATILPIAIPHDVTTPDLAKQFLPPKLFSVGTGFWDGTKTYNNIVYDFENETPAEFKKNAVREILSYRDELASTTNVYAFGGSFVLVTDNTSTEPDYLQHRTDVLFTTKGNYVLTVDMNGKESVDPYILTDYRVVLYSKDNNDREKFVVLKDWSKDYSLLEINISDKLEEEGLTSFRGKIRFEANQVEGINEYGYKKEGYIMFDSLEIKALGEVDEETTNLLEEISIDNANYTIMLNKLDSGLFPNGYWSCTGRKEVHNTQIRYVDFIYDHYEAKLGLNEISLGKSTMDEYINKGWCEYNYSIGPESFKILSDKCPIVEIISQTYNKKDNYYTINCTATIYKYKGYSSMPIFIFGTDNFGYDLLKVCFNGLKASLILAVCASSVCFIFGLCWGSISGYFGGNVDLFMERFCDILGGVPWIVVMTLAILLLGNTVVTFALALCLTGWMGTAARTRTQFYRFKGREYILASRTLGANDIRLIFKHILPNAMGTIITSSVLMIPGVIFSEATLSYLNLGLQGSNSFGNILSENQSYLGSHPALIIVPAVIISLIMISFNLFGNGLRDAFNPSLKGSE